MSLQQNKSLFLIIVVAALFQGCSTPVKDQPKKPLKFGYTNLYHIDIKGSINGIDTYYQPKGSENVYILDMNNYSFHVLNTAQGSFRKLGAVPQIEQMDEFSGFTVDEKDRKLYVFSPDTLYVYHLDGKRVKAMYFKDPESGYIDQSSSYFAPIIKNGKMYLSYFPKAKGSFRNPKYYQAPVEAEYDLKTGKTRLLAQGYPATYQQYCYGIHHKADRIEIDPVTHGYTFPHSDSIYLCNIKTGERSVRFFGAKTDKKFEHLSFNQLKTLNESVYLELVQKNPHYSFPTYAPLASYYFRELVTPPKTGGNVLAERLIIFDKELNYIGEAKFKPSYLIDSKKGLLAIYMENDEIVIDRLSW